MGAGGDLGKLLLRVSVAGLLILHGIHKIQHGVGGVEGLLEAKDLPTFLAYGVYLSEVAAPALVIVGFQTRLAALVMAGGMAVAIWLAHMEMLGHLNAMGGWAVEFPALFLFGALSIALIGPGSMSMDGRKKSD